jgi:hypothetical protein
MIPICDVGMLMGTPMCSHNCDGGSVLHLFVSSSSVCSRDAALSGAIAWPWLFTSLLVGLYNVVRSGPSFNVQLGASTCGLVLQRAAWCFNVRLGALMCGLVLQRAAWCFNVLPDSGTDRIDRG